MAYTKHTWQCGEKITTEQLNRIEDGIGMALNGGNFRVVTITGGDESYSADLSCDEMKEVIRSGGYLVAFYQDRYFPLVNIDPNILSDGTTNGLLRIGVTPIITFANAVANHGNTNITYIDVYERTDGCGIRIRTSKYIYGVGVVATGTGTCDDHEYKTFDVSYKDISDAIDSNATIFYIGDDNLPRDTVMQVQLSDRTLPDGTHLYEVTMWTPSGEKHFYAISTTDPLRDYDCWSK